MDQSVRERKRERKTERKKKEGESKLKVKEREGKEKETERSDHTYISKRKRKKILATLDTVPSYSKHREREREHTGSAKSRDVLSSSTMCLTSSRSPFSAARKISCCGWFTELMLLFCENDIYFLKFVSQLGKQHRQFVYMYRVYFVDFQMYDGLGV